MVQTKVNKYKRLYFRERIRLFIHLFNSATVKITHTKKYLGLQLQSATKIVRQTPFPPLLNVKLDCGFVSGPSGTDFATATLN